MIARAGAWVGFLFGLAAQAAGADRAWWGGLAFTAACTYLAIATGG